MSNAAVPLIVISIVVVIGITIFLMMNHEDEDEDEVETTILPRNITVTKVPVADKDSAVESCDGRLLNNTKNIALAKKCDLLEQDSTCYEISGMGLALKKLDKLSEADAKKCYPALKDQIENVCYKRGPNITIKKDLGDFELSVKGRQEAYNCGLLDKEKHPDPACFASDTKRFPFLGYAKLIDSQADGKMAQICYPDLADKIPTDKKEAKCKKVFGAELKDKTLEDFKTIDDAHECKKITGDKNCYRLDGGKIEKMPLKYFMESGTNIDYNHCWKDDVAKEGKKECFIYKNNVLQSKKKLEEMSSIEQAKKCYRVPTTAKSECYGTVNGKFKKLTRDELRRKGGDVDKNLNNCYGSGQTEEEKKCWKSVNNELVKKQDDEVTNANDAKLCGLLPGDKGPSCYKLEYDEMGYSDKKYWQPKLAYDFKDRDEANACGVLLSDINCYRNKPGELVRRWSPKELIDMNKNDLLTACYPGYTPDETDTMCAKYKNGNWVKKTKREFGTGERARQNAWDCGALDKNYPIGCWNSAYEGFPEISMDFWMTALAPSGNFAYHHMLPKCFPGQCNSRPIGDFPNREAAGACGRLKGNINCYNQQSPYGKHSLDWLYNNGYYNLVPQCYPGAPMPRDNRDCYIMRDGNVKKIQSANDLKGLGLNATQLSDKYTNWVENC
jgi:hypothetical protein